MTDAESQFTRGNRVTHDEVQEFITECDVIWRQYKSLLRYPVAEETHLLLLESMRILDNILAVEASAVKKSFTKA